MHTWVSAVRSFEHTAGEIVRCLRQAGTIAFQAQTRKAPELEHATGWLYTRLDGFPATTHAKHCMGPIFFAISHCNPPIFPRNQNSRRSYTASVITYTEKSNAGRMMIYETIILPALDFSATSVTGLPRSEQKRPLLLQSKIKRDWNLDGVEDQKS